MAKAKTEEEETEANLLPVMNIMLLLIPALLLAMEVARMGAIAVAPPTFTKGGAEDTAPPPKTQQLRVFVAEDGFVLTTTDAAGEPKRIALTDDRKDLLDPSRYDYAALEAEAVRLRALQFEPLVRVDAEGSIPMSALVATLDALRGSECRLGQVAAGENPPDECLFWNVVVDPGAGHG
jgi:biopolymer transport protein ExbD